MMDGVLLASFGIWVGYICEVFSVSMFLPLGTFLSSFLFIWVYYYLLLELFFLDISAVLGSWRCVWILDLSRPIGIGYERASLVCADLGHGVFAMREENGV
jgi:hypothetical protein